MNKILKSPEAISLMVGTAVVGISLKYLKILQQRRSEKFKKALKLIYRRTTKLYFQLSGRIICTHESRINLPPNIPIRDRNGFLSDEAMNQVMYMIENDPEEHLKKIREAEEKVLEEMKINRKEFEFWLSGETYFTKDEKLKKILAITNNNFYLVLAGSVPNNSLISQDEANRKIPLDIAKETIKEKCKTLAHLIPQFIQSFLDEKGSFGKEHVSLFQVMIGRFELEFIEVTEEKLKNMRSLKENFENEELFHPWDFYFIQRKLVFQLPEIKGIISKFGLLLRTLYQKLLKEDVRVVDMDGFFTIMKEIVDKAMKEKGQDLSEILDWMKK